MSRYPAIGLSLAALALLYGLAGGFDRTAADGHSPQPTEELAAPDTVARADLAPSEDAQGGPDDGPTFRGASSEPGFHAQDPDRPAADLSDWEELRIRRGESFYVALRRAGLDHETIMQLVAACKPHTNLKRVQRGDRFLLSRPEGEFRALRFDLDRERYVVLERVDDEIRARVANYPIEQSTRAVRGVIETSLFDALKAEQADPVLADQMAEILGWKIDFFRDLRRGDEFVAVYREYTHDDDSVRDPVVLAVQFHNRGEVYEAYRFTNDLGLPAYYNPDGTSLERQFLRAPLKYSRISSGFSYRRLHPVLHRYQPHWGVDFVAPKGTPVMATADGTVIRRGYDKASGNAVGIRHGNGYESYYLHLSRYPRSLSVGDKVKQGEVIGFVGSTGWATAAHLDYRIKKNGTWVNPRKLSLPPADPVSEDRRPEFTQRVAQLHAMLAEVPREPTTVVLEERTLHEGSASMLR
jgi:murein DD-endopeptidase MepM/ murein hydrolase activator NlpD